MEGGLEVRVVDVEDVQIEARGPGEISGPGVAVRVAIVNKSGDPIDLNGSALNAAFGSTPASPTAAPPTEPLQGVLEPSESAEGVYAFLKPAGAAGGLVITFEHSGSSDVVEVRQ
jgi:hypothetical protein